MMDYFIFTIAVHCKDHSMFAKFLFSRLPLTKLNVSRGSVHEGKKTKKIWSVGTYSSNGNVHCAWTLSRTLCWYLHLCIFQMFGYTIWPWIKMVMSKRETKMHSWITICQCVLENGLESVDNDWTHHIKEAEDYFANSSINLTVQCSPEPR